MSHRLFLFSFIEVMCQYIKVKKEEVKRVRSQRQEKEQSIGKRKKTEKTAVEVTKNEESKDE